MEFDEEVIDKEFELHFDITKMPRTALEELDEKRNATLEKCVKILHDKSSSEEQYQEAIGILMENECVYAPETANDLLDNKVADEDLFKPSDGSEFTEQYKVTKPVDEKDPTKLKEMTEAQRHVYLRQQAEQVGNQFCVKNGSAQPMMFFKTTDGTYEAMPLQKRYASSQFLSTYVEKWLTLQNTNATIIERRNALKVLWENYCMYDENGLLISPQNYSARNETENIYFHSPVNEQEAPTRVIKNPMPELNKELVAQREQEKAEKKAQEE